MRLIFAGTPPFAAAALAALLAAGHEVALVLTQPDKPAGRGQKLTESAVGQLARERGLPLLKPNSLKPADIQAELRAQHAEVMVVAAYGLLLPQAVLDIPRHGCLNIHGSLLPRWRGAAPVQRAIEAGDTKTGIGIMQMEAGLDTGPILLERELAIAPDDTSASLFDKLTTLGAQTIVDALASLSTLTPRVQPTEGVTYAHKLSKAEASVDWAQSAPLLERRMRAFDPFPGMEAILPSKDKLKLWRAVSIENAPNAAPGIVIDASPQSLVIACGEGALSLQTVQRPGGKRQPIGEYLRAYPVSRGEQWT